MTSRERLLCALSGRTPDRVPYCEVGVSEAVVRGLEAAGRTEGPVWAPNPAGIDEMDARSPEREAGISRLLGRDHICYRAQPPIPAERREGGGGIVFYADGPVKTLRDVDRIVLPDPEGEALWAAAPAFLSAAGSLATCAVTRVGISAAYLAMGMETFSVALYESPRLVEAVLDRYSDWSARVVRHAARLGFDFVWTADDLAFKTGLLVSPAMFRKVILPYARRVADAVSVPWVFHSDGDLSAILPDLVDLGIAALNPVEPGAMDIAAVKRAWGSRICLIGNVGVHTLSAGTPEDVESEVLDLLAEVAPGGGYALSSGNSLASYCRPGNVRAMLDALFRWGRYPIRVPRAAAEAVR